MEMELEIDGTPKRWINVTDPGWMLHTRLVRRLGSETARSWYG